METSRVVTSILQITQELLEAVSSAHHGTSAGVAVLEGELYQLKQILSPFLYLDPRPADGADKVPDGALEDGRLAFELA